MKPTTWKNCYSQQWAGILIPAAFAHPAKISLALVKKIFAHALENGWIQKGDTCLDPFAGVGGVAFGAMAAGLKFVGQELEPHFVELANGMECTPEKLCPTCKARSEQTASKNGNLFDEVTGNHHFEGNLEFWQRKFGLSGAVILQGDSRKLLENLRDKVECVVSSPPYADHLTGQTESIDEKRLLRLKKAGYQTRELGIQRSVNSKNQSAAYSSNKNNLGNLPVGNFDAVISSSPYASSIHSGNGIDPDKLTGNKAGKNSQAFSQGYGDSPAQLAAMPEGRFDITVSSPPYEKSLDNILSKSDDGKDSGAVATFRRTGKWPERRPKGLDYGISKNQLGNESGATFWSAAREIVAQCFLALKPGGHAIWVCKNFVRNGKIVEFSQQWARLCEAVGFELVCWHQASLVEVGASQLNVHGEDTVKIKSRKSFFRRLAEKNGSPEINHEDVICFVKPTKTFERLYLDGRNDKSELKTERVTL